MNTYFNINYEFDRGQVHQAIARRLAEPGSDYICVADGVILNTVNRVPGNREAVCSPFATAAMCRCTSNGYMARSISSIAAARYSGILCPRENIA